MMTDAIYGAAPRDLGLVDLCPREMMFWLYCPVKLPGMTGLVYPPNLHQFYPLMKIVEADLREAQWRSSYVYITAKTLYTTPENPGNRPGWHSDGFLTDDINYIWCDANPTIFWEGGPVSFSADHSAALAEMDAVAESDPSGHRVYPIKHLLRLDQLVLHKVATDVRPGIRTFVKISVSTERYALTGNSINHGLAVDWKFEDRQAERNCPRGAT